jgi:hypothetical protein
MLHSCALRHSIPGHPRHRAVVNFGQVINDMTEVEKIGLIVFSFAIFLFWLSTGLALAGRPLGVSLAPKWLERFVFGQRKHS